MGRRREPGGQLVAFAVQQVQVPAGLTPAEFVIQRRFFFVGSVSRSRSDVSPHLMRTVEVAVLAPTKE
jgi:hypothetical protein